MVSLVFLIRLTTSLQLRITTLCGTAVGKYFVVKHFRANTRINVMTTRKSKAFDVTSFNNVAIRFNPAMLATPLVLCLNTNCTEMSSHLPRC